MIQLEQESARWAQFTLLEQAEALRKEAVKARKRAAGHLPIKRAAEHVANGLDRAARALQDAAAEIAKPENVDVPHAHS